MQTQVRYEKETKVVSFGDRTIRINNYTPILTQKERERRRKEIEQRLFDIYVKYENKAQ